MGSLQGADDALGGRLGDFLGVLKEWTIIPRLP